MFIKLFVWCYVISGAFKHISDILEDFAKVACPVPPTPETLHMFAPYAGLLPLSGRPFPKFPNFPKYCKEVRNIAHKTQGLKGQGLYAQWQNGVVNHKALSNVYGYALRLRCLLGLI